MVSAAPALIYHMLMLPAWFADHAAWNSDYEVDGLHLVIKEDSANWENILRVQLLPSDYLTSSDDITVDVVVKAYDRKSDDNGPISFVLSDGSYAFGFQLNGEENALTAVEGESGKILRNVNLGVASARKRPCREVRMSFKPKAAWGSAGCAGARLLAQFSDTLHLSKGLQLELYRYRSTDTYTVDYADVTVYKDSPNQV